MQQKILRLKKQNLLLASLLFIVGVYIFSLPFVVLLGKLTGTLVLLNALRELLALSFMFGCAVMLRKHLAVFLQARLVWAIGLYALLNIFYVLVSANKFQALIGAAINLRFLIMFVAAALIGRELNDKGALYVYKKLLFSVAVVLGVVAFLQVFALPNDFMQIFGYERLGEITSGVPPAQIPLADDTNTIRPQASLRGPNVLGAFLILPIVITASLLTDKKNKIVKICLPGLMAVLYLTHSRSAWLGGVASMAYLTFSHALKIRGKEICLLLGGLLVATVLLFISIKNTYFYRTVILHDSPYAAESSNAGHVRALREGTREVIGDPLGDGPGSAGPASALAKDVQPKIAENYFLQIGQELGWTGLLLIILIHGELSYLLWKQKKDKTAHILLASLVGIFVTNFLLHTWADDAVSVTWWSFAGLYYGIVILKRNDIKKTNTKASDPVRRVYG